MAASSRNGGAALHARIVEALEALAGDRIGEVASGAKGLPAGRQDPDQVERLAHHALRGDVWAKALAYCRQAGEKAMTRPAYHESAEYFEQALSVLPHLPEQRDTLEQAIDLRFALRSALQPLGDSGRILALLREAEALAQALDDPRRLGRVSLFLSRYFSHMGAHDQAIAAGQSARSLKPTTARPSPSPKPSACARSRPTATMALGPCMRSSASGSRPTWNWQRPSTSTAPWR
jgi:tetratricopeptide (TPR) repeat protein